MDNTRAIRRKSNSTPSVKSGKNYFLGIGINDYTGGLAALHNAVRDVERVGQILQAKYDFEILSILTNEQATRSEILKQLRALQSLSADDSLLIYYSGHGHKETEDAYWVPVDSNADDIHDYIPNTYLRSLIKAIPTRHTLLIADSCYSGSFFPESETKNMRGAAEELEKYRSRWAFCSGRHDQKVSDGLKGKHSPFANALITELDRNTESKIFIQELAVSVIKRTTSEYRQLPKANAIFDCGDDGGQFIFTLKNSDTKQKEQPLSKIEELEKQLEELRKLVVQQTPQYKTSKSQDFSIPQQDNIILANFAITDGIDLTQKPMKVEASSPIKFENVKERPLQSKVPKIIIPKPKIDFEPQMVFVKGGTFIRDSQKVVLSDFSIGTYPITQAQWKAIIGRNPSKFRGVDLPVEQVSWEDCQDYINKLNQKTDKVYRLPTEAEWEFAARGGNLSEGYIYSGGNTIERVGWYWKNSGDAVLTGKWDTNTISKNNCKTHPIGIKKRNELGIFDMSGNVWEWCSDWFGEYSQRSLINPQGADTGTERVCRGGSWRGGQDNCRVISRYSNSPISRGSRSGLRLAMSIK